MSDPAEPPPDVPPAPHRSTGTWLAIILVWCVGLIAWTVWLGAGALLILRIIG